MTPAPSLAAILATGERERLYSGLSVLVSTAADGERCVALATFRSLELLLDDAGARGRGGDDSFDRSLRELVAMALELDPLEVYACAASIETLGIAPEDAERRLRGVLSTPRFQREARGATLIFV